MLKIRRRLDVMTAANLQFTWVNEHFERIRKQRFLFLFSISFLLVNLFVIIETHTNAHNIPIPPIPPKRHDIPAKPKSATELVKIFADYDLKLADVRKGNKDIPRVYFQALPKDMHRRLHLNKRQEMFILSVLPLILKVNEDIADDRRYLLSLKKSPKTLSSQDQRKVTALAEKYNLKTTNISRMLIHVDIIPPSLALAQTCLETGWGSSSAARTKNSLFGMTISKVVKGYDSLHDCTWAYMRNLNYNKAYKKFRTLRAQMRKTNKPFDSVKLSASLTEYCEFTRSYLRDLRLILTHYKLSDFDQISLAKAPGYLAVG
ncbi:MAG: glucosaminidase domain-containing protein [Pseudomonadota bacterium]